MLKCAKHIACLLLLLCVPVGLISQEKTTNGDRIAFFKARAWADAQNEQYLRHTHPEDERDYWEDQRNFEKDLKKLSYQAYQVYLREKKNAYLAHEANCEKDHGAYYYAMSAFYKHYGPVKGPYLDPKKAESEPVSVVEKKGKR